MQVSFVLVIDYCLEDFVKNKNVKCTYTKIKKPYMFNIYIF